MEVIGSKAKRTAANTIAPHPNADTFVPSSQNAEQDAETFRYRGGEFPVGEPAQPSPAANAAPTHATTPPKQPHRRQQTMPLPRLR